MWSALTHLRIAKLKTAYPVLFCWILFVPTSLSFATDHDLLPSIYHEAPSLNQMVARGELPPLEERLPRNPMLVQPFERIGSYGGTWQRAVEQGTRPLLSA